MPIQLEILLPLCETDSLLQRVYGYQMQQPNAFVGLTVTVNVSFCTEYKTYVCDALPQNMKQVTFWVK